MIVCHFWYETKHVVILLKLPSVLQSQLWCYTYKHKQIFALFNLL